MYCRWRLVTHSEIVFAVELALSRDIEPLTRTVLGIMTAVYLYIAALATVI